MKKIGLAVATFFGIGYLPVAPGTWASAFVALIVYFTPLAGAPFLVMAGITAAVFVLGIPAAGSQRNAFWEKRPAALRHRRSGRPIGQPLVPSAPGGLLCGRLFSVPHLRYHQAVPGEQKRSPCPDGLGIMVDDVLAGAYVLALLLLARRFSSIRPS